MIRRAVKEDLPEITGIYNQAIASGRATADIQPFSAEQREGWFSINENDRTPVYVYERDGAVVGYSYLSGYRQGRKALETISEISYYVDYRHHGRGIGSGLMQYTIDRAKELGYKNLLAILLSCNDGSVALLEKYGFVLWGILPDIACLGGNVYSHLYYGLKLEQA